MRVGLLMALLAACGFSKDVTGGDSVADDASGGETDAAIDASTTNSMCGNCDDSDPCTIDACVGTNCTHAMLMAPAACAGTIERCAGQTTCYLHCTAARTWTAAENLCDAWGGHLATVTSTAETACMDAWLTGPGWIGYVQEAADPEPAGGWEWISTQTSAYVNWIPPQPNNNVDILPQGQDCAYAEGAQQGTWFDHECTEAFRYVCEQ